MSYPIVGSLGTPALVGIIGNIHQRLYPLYSHGFSALSPADSNVPQILHHSEANWQIALLTCSGRVLLRCWNATTILYFFLQESWRCIVSTKCWRRLGLLQWTRLRVEGKECEGIACLTNRNFFFMYSGDLWTSSQAKPNTSTNKYLTHTTSWSLVYVWWTNKRRGVHRHVCDLRLGHGLSLFLQEEGWGWYWVLIPSRWWRGQCSLWTSPSTLIYTPKTA